LDLSKRCIRAVKDFVGFDIEQATYTEYYPVSDQIGSESPLARADTYMSLLGSGSLETVGVSDLFLKQRPVRSITSIHENRGAWDANAASGDWSSDSLLASGSDYKVDWDEDGLCMSGTITRQGIWPSAKRSVRVVYVGGFTADELASERWSAFKEAALLTIQMKYMDLQSLRQNTDRTGVGPMTSERIGDWAGSWSVATIDHLFGMKMQIPPSAKDALRTYVSMAKFMSR
jgi:hypothetical protein